MALEWKDGGSEPFMWSTNGRRVWCAVWAQGDIFAAWVSGPSGRKTAVHPTEGDAMRWCEVELEDAEQR
jgi:hypothetical protein